MKFASAYRTGRGIRARWLAIAAAAVLAGFSLPALAQAPSQQQAAADGKLLLEADQLLYDFDSETVTAIGNVQIYYGAAYLDAPRVVYDQKSGRLIASGGVRLVEPNGNIISADTIDITDDFRDAFIASLNVVTIDQARFSAQTAERRDGNLIIFHKGVYTACRACLQNPNRPPLWQIKAARIIHDRAERTIYYDSAQLEFFGVPIAYVPFFSHPDPTVRRKTGFLTPSFKQRDSIGFGVTTPFFWNLAPNYDVTFSPTFLTRQGLLMETEWRHRVMNGSYSIRLAGIFQRDKDAFVEDGEELSGYRDFRGSAHTVGDFAINSRWRVGWDAHAHVRPHVQPRLQHRPRPSAGLDIDCVPDRHERPQLLRPARLLFQRAARGHRGRDSRRSRRRSRPGHLCPRRPGRAGHRAADCRPQLYRRPARSRGRAKVRHQLHQRFARRERHPPSGWLRPEYFAGVAGNFTRLTTRASWQRRLIAPGGQLVTPFTYLQADANFFSFDDEAAGLQSEEVIARAMPAVGVEYEWPMLAIAGNSVHTFGPKAQLIARPSEQHSGDLPNEDAQSLVFDDTTLFELDKFSGYDRQEGGTRANVGLTYQGLFGNGASLDAVFGRSFHLCRTQSLQRQGPCLDGPRLGA